MSRAFVKEGDGRPEKPPPRAVGDRPNYVTPEGLALLQAALESAREAGDERNVAYYEDRVASAVVKKKPARKHGKAAFGSTVLVREGDGKQLRLRIVGEDEADPAHGAISWISPYAQALLDHRAGDRVVVQRPRGPVTVSIEAVDP